MNLLLWAQSPLQFSGSGRCSWTHQPSYTSFTVHVYIVSQESALQIQRPVGKTAWKWWHMAWLWLPPLILTQAHIHNAESFNSPHPTSILIHGKRNVLSSFVHEEDAIAWWNKLRHAELSSWMTLYKLLNNYGFHSLIYKWAVIIYSFHDHEKPKIKIQTYVLHGASDPNVKEIMELAERHKRLYSNCSFIL
jgi:hypothetical protein